MARLPTSLRVMDEDVKDSPSWFRKPQQVYNTFNQAIYEAMDGHVSFTENIQCQIKEMTFTTETTYSSGTWNNITFVNTLKVKPISVKLCQIFMTHDLETPIKEAVTLDWLSVNGSIVIRFMTGLADAVMYTARFEVY